MYTLPVIKIIKEILEEFELSPVIREPLLLAQDMLGKAERENSRLVKKIAKLERETKKLRKQANDRSRDSEFVEYLGVKFKRKVSGGYERAPICPECLGPMSSLGDVIPFNCSRCKIYASFDGHNLDSVLKDVEREFSE